MSTPLISIVIPTYNRADFLREALESVSAQTYPHWECVVVDDGSTDETESVVSGFGNRVHYYRQANAGPAVARNYGIELATGSLLLFLDSDDLLLPDALACLVDALQEQPDADVAYGGFYIRNPDGTFSTQRHIGLPVLSAPPDPGVDPSAVAYGFSKEGNLLPDLLQHDAILMGTALLRRATVEAVGGFDSSLPHQEHSDFALRVAKTGAHFTPACKAVLLLRIHEDNRSLDGVEMLRCRIERVESHLPAEVSSAKHLRARGRADAYMGSATLLARQNRLPIALVCLRHALIGTWLPLSAYIDCLSLIARKICGEAWSMDDSLQHLHRRLDPFRESPNQRAFRHFVLSHFRRESAIRALRTLEWTRAETWGHIGAAVIQGGYSCAHLGASVAAHWRLSGAVFRRVRSRVGVFLR